MSNNISHTHPITEKLLNNEISINNLNLDTFLSDRIIYPTTKKAKHKGYYAHHLIPIQEQINSYNKTHSNKFSNRIDFLKNCKELDDRCYRLTAFEHIVVHYLLALQIDSQKEALCKMVNTDFKALNNQTEKEIIETFIKSSSLIDEGRKISGKKQSEFMKINNPDFNPEVREKIKKALTGRTLTKEHKKHVSETRKRLIKEGKIPSRKGCKGRPWTEEDTIKRNKTLQEKFNNLSEEEKEKIRLKNIQKGKQCSLNRDREKWLNSIRQTQKEYQEAKKSGAFLGTWNEFQKNKKLNKKIT